MTTYIIQYLEDGTWHNYRAANSSFCEFLCLHDAEKVMDDLNTLNHLEYICHNLPRYTAFQIKDSTGTVVKKI